MSTHTSSAIRPNRRRLGGNHSPVCFQMPIEHRRQIQALAEYKRWPEAEVYRQAVIFFLAENVHLLQMLNIDEAPNGHDDA